ncbi:sensor histidine kinase [Cohnella soli]|uniref:Sensor histidine kinase n=1 Tax=Cohnella soli TaxID=425005 RepID=A0ABW0HPG2_9BACL
MKKRILLGLLLGSIASLQFWYFFISLNQPYLGVELQNKEHHWFVTHVDSESKSIPIGALKIDDEIVSINGQKTSDYSSIIKWGSIAGAESFVVLRAGEEHKIDVQKNSNLFSYDYLGLSVELLCFAVAASIYKRLAHIRSAKYLSFVFISIGGAFMSLGASVRDDLMGKAVIGTCVVLLPVVLMHFFIVFFEDRGKKPGRNSTIQLMYGLVVLTLIFHGLLFVAGAKVYSLFRSLYLYNITLFIVGVIANIIYLITIYSKIRKENKELRMIIRTIGASFILSFLPLICFSFLPSLLMGRTGVSSVYSSWAVLFFPLSFTYLLVSKKLYDIDLVIRRFILTTLVALIPSGIIVGAIALLYPEENETNRLIATFLLIVVLFSFILYSLEYLTTKLERVMFPRKYHLQQSLKKIAKNLRHISSFRELREIILIDITETLQVLGGAIIFLHKSNKEIISVGNIDEYEAGILAEAESPEHPTYIRLEITRNEEYACYLILTQKKANTYLGHEELQWLNLVISYLSISLENLHLIRKITLRLEKLAAHIPTEEASGDFAWFRKLMFELQEKERVRIALDLHDSTMQDLFFLKRRCTSVIGNQKLTTDDLEQMKSIVNFIDIINLNLRQSCFELHPYLLQELGLIKTIEKQINLESSNSLFEIEFRTSSPSLIESCTMEMKRHIFRIIQELLNNAKKHSQATRLKINLLATGSRLTLAYEDNGIGFDTTEKWEREIGGSRTGMEYMKSRILSLNGLYELNSSKGNGMKLKAVFPI